tara:strand:+ start:779 stop:1978 length:1200 start_codon:yes stop_codon:yes gene_type:complete
MNIQDMHLAVKQGVDKINSLQADLLLPEEIDIELNKALTRFINNRLIIRNGQGFESSQKRIDDLKNLIREYEETVTYKEQISSKIFVDSFELPSDYLHLINQRSYVIQNDCQPISFTVKNPAAVDVYYFLVNFENFFLNFNTAFYAYILATADPSSPLNQALLINPFNFTPGMSFPATIEQYKQDLLDSANWEPGFQVYWEKYLDIEKPGNMIITIDPNVHSWVNWDASVTNATSGTNLITQLVGIGVTIDPVTGIGTPNATDDVANQFSPVKYLSLSAGAYREANTYSSAEWAANKFVQHDDIFTLLNDPFNKTKPSGPLTTIRNDEIDIYTSDIFIIEKVKITYLRKPQKISLSLGQSCELPEHNHQEVVDMTVSSILETFQDSRYQTNQIEEAKNK